MSTQWLANHRWLASIQFIAQICPEQVNRTRDYSHVSIRRYRPPLVDWFIDSFFHALSLSLSVDQRDERKKNTDTIRSFLFSQKQSSTMILIFSHRHTYISHQPSTQRNQRSVLNSVSRWQWRANQRQTYMPLIRCFRAKFELSSKRCVWKGCVSKDMISLDSIRPRFNVRASSEKKTKIQMTSSNRTLLPVRNAWAMVAQRPGHGCQRKSERNLPVSAIFGTGVR